MRRLRVLRLVVVLLGLPASAWAACGERDLEGTWDLKAESDGEMGHLTMTCEVNVSGSGEVQSGTDCTQKSSEGLEVQTKVDGGEITLSRRCRATGQILIGGFETTITEARMNRTKNQVVGAGQNVVDGAAVSFTATRQAAAVLEQQEAERPTKRRRHWWHFW